MAPLRSIPSPRRFDRGGVSWVTVLLLAAIAGGVYLAIAWAPIYVVHYEVKQTVRDFMNQAIKNKGDDQLVKRMCGKLAVLDTTMVVGEDGTEERVPSVQVDPADVTWERDTSTTPPILHVAFEYTRQVRYPFSGEVSEWVGTVDMTNELAVPDWGPAR